MTQFDIFLIKCTSKWLSRVIVISQLHVDMETEPSKMLSLIHPDMTELYALNPH